MYNSRKLPISGDSSDRGYPLLDLVAMSLQKLAAVALPDRGSVVVGRSAGADLPIADASVSPEHVRITVQSGALTVEDLGSEAGTFLGEAPLGRGERAPVVPGEPVRIGGTTLMIRPRTSRLQLRRLWSPAEFTELLEDECLRAQRRPSVFALLDIESGPAQGFAELVSRLDAAIPAPHLLGASEQGLQALLVAVPRAVIEACLEVCLDQLRGGLLAGDRQVRCGVAWYPRDGRSPGSLRAIARKRAR